MPLLCHMLQALASLNARVVRTQPQWILSRAREASPATGMLEGRVFRRPPNSKLCALRARALPQQRVEGGANGGMVVTRHSGLVPQGVNNLGEALATICSLASFPSMPRP
jgi:hypothetical protein